MKIYKKVKILKNERLYGDICEMILESGDMEGYAGQFIEMHIDNGTNLLPRPISICELGSGFIRIIFHTPGVGTKYLAGLKEGDYVRIMAPLGKGFPIKDYKNVAVVGGGIGVPPLLQLAKEISSDKTVFLGFRSKPILDKEFGDKVYIATDDGSVGYKGNIVSLIKEKDFPFDCIYACGPRAMLKSLAKYAEEKAIDCYVSMEERMACGFGACVGCAIKVKLGDGYIYKKVCTDGPVFDSREVAWDD